MILKNETGTAEYLEAKDKWLATVACNGETHEFHSSQAALGWTWIRDTTIRGAAGRMRQ